MSSSSLAPFGALGVRRTPCVRSKPRQTRVAVFAAGSKDTSKDAKRGEKTKNINKKTGVGVETSSSLPVPMPVAAGGGLFLSLALFRAILRNKNKGSLTSLEERGALDENRDVDEAKFYAGMMKSVRTVQMPELTDQQISAARERRRQSMLNEDADASKSLKSTTLPKNHPFATSETIDPNESKKQFEKVREMNKPRTRQRGTPPK